MRVTNDHKEIQKGKCSFFNRNSYLNCQWAAPVVLKCEYKLKKIKTCHSNVLFFNRHLYINIVMVLSFICHCICVLYFLSFVLFPSCVLVFLCSFPSLFPSTPSVLQLPYPRPVPSVVSLPCYSTSASLVLPCFQRFLSASFLFLPLPSFCSPVLLCLSLPAFHPLVSIVSI